MTVELDSLEDGRPRKMAFQVLKKAAGTGAARLGRLSLPKRHVIETPNFIAETSRGCVPHLTPDNMTKHASIAAGYMALEDFVEKKNPAIYKTPASPQSKPLHSFTAFPDNIPTILGPRRAQPVVTPVGNGNKYLTIWTSTGHATLPIDSYISAITKVKPDMAIPPADLFHTSSMPSSKKLVRMAERTEEWSIQLLAKREQLRRDDVSLFAPVLGVPYHVQWEYLNHLADNVDALEGLAIYSMDMMTDLAENYALLAPLARFSMEGSRTPQQVLRQVEAGIDLCTVPFLNGVSDAGVALSFEFPPPEGQSSSTSSSGPPPLPLPLGTDMWTPDHATSLEPLTGGCECYTCTNHHRAFVHHLLNSKEMLGWTLLQIHNHRVLSEFFAGIRAVLADDGSGNTFEEHVKAFGAAYQDELPKGSGNRPRARGYHFKSAQGQEKEAPKWENYNAKAEEPAPIVIPEQLVLTGTTAEAPLVSEMSSVELESTAATTVNKQ